ncbi:DUF6228 family protein [Streptomyces sp. NBC_00576]|uniref:DUF6228 family protein n=1 Tax=Streptomyces sp. NBC_00576 TaxID=2903665 RepID=UPI002E804885|nr:DUF6228 family protein [Streptomyces sp. NBC_00576]WUB74124.1 DUF6228 family protein [Streptomyces sp. NBC_00576]
MSSPDDGTDNEPGVVIRCHDNSSVGVELCERYSHSLDEDAVYFAVELRAPGLTARVDDVVAWAWGSGLALFLEALASDFRGWNGERSWGSDDTDLAVSAVFRTGGYVGLTWTLCPWPAASGGWAASVTTWLEAGEQMTSLAADVRRFLGEERP